MRQSVRITNTSAPTQWILVQETRYSFPNERMVGQHLEGSDKEGIFHLALEYKGRVTAAVCVFERREDGEGSWFDYRMIREEEGPVAVSYPTRLLDMLSPPRNGLARRWRASCKALSDTSGLDCASVEAGDHVFLPASSIPVSRPVAPHAVLRCLSAGGGFVRAIEIDPSTGVDLGLAHLNLIAADVRLTAFPVPQNRQSLALDLRRFFSGTMSDLSDIDDLPEFDSYMSCVWELDGQPWRPKRIAMLGENEVEAQKAAIASGGLLLTFEAIGRPDRLSVELVFGPSGEAVAVDVGGPPGLVGRQGTSDCVLELLADLERRMNMPVERKDKSYAPTHDERVYDAEDDEAYGYLISTSM